MRKIPDPIASYPLNNHYKIRELENRQPQGNPVGVTLAAGPNGKAGGSYQFTGQANSYIEFPNNGGLDTERSITMLCWLYPQSTDGPIFNYKHYVMLAVSLQTDQSSIIKQVVHGVSTCGWYQESCLLVSQREIINLLNI